MSTIPSALAAINTLLEIGDGGSPEHFARIANCGDLTGPGISGNVVDVTSHSTGTPWREKVVTLLDPATVGTTLYFIPSSGGPTGTPLVIGHDGTNGLLSKFTSRVLMNCKLIFPDTASTTYLFQAYLTKFNFKEPVAGVVTADVEFTLTGEPTFA